MSVVLDPWPWAAKGHWLSPETIRDRDDAQAPRADPSGARSPGIRVPGWCGIGTAESKAPPDQQLQPLPRFASNLTLDLLILSPQDSQNIPSLLSSARLGHTAFLKAEGLPAPVGLQPSSCVVPAPRLSSTIRTPPPH